MKNTAYILTFDRSDSLNYKAIHDKIIKMDGLVNWFHYIRSSYILIHKEEKAYPLTKKIESIMPNKRFFLVEINLNNRNGWLPKEAWEWLNKQAKLLNISEV